MNNAVGAQLNEARVMVTPRGPVVIQGPAESEYLETLVMNDCLKGFRSPERQHQALITIANFYEGMVYIARYKKEIIGYITFHYPDEGSRWRSQPRILELGSVEVSNDWRKLGIGRSLLEEAFSNERFNHHIVITTEYCWHWDLKGTGVDVWTYQRLLTKLFGGVGFVRRHTDDPEILEHPANVFMARLGGKVSKEDLMRFEAICFKKGLFGL